MTAFPSAEDLVKVLLRARTAPGIADALLEAGMKLNGDAVVAALVGIMVERQVVPPMEMARALLRNAPSAPAHQAPSNPSLSNAPDGAATSNPAVASAGR